MFKTVKQVVREFETADEIASKAEKTRKRSALVLRMLLTKISPTDPIARLDRHHIDLTLSDARKRGVAESSLNGYRTDLRRFGGWLHQCGYVKINPAGHVRNVKAVTEASKRKPITREQARELIMVADSRHPRDRVIAMIMLSTALRDGEITGLRWKDASFEDSAFAAYRSKLRDYHTVPWTPQLAEELERWRTYVEELHGPVQPDWYIVPALAYRGGSKTYARMNRHWPMIPTRRQATFGPYIKEFLRAVGETDLRGRASHTLRRTAANLLIEAGGDIRDAQTLLGHASVAMTEIYLSKDIARAKLRDRVQNFEI